jgi:hypothetical protein
VVRRVAGLAHHPARGGGQTSKEDVVDGPWAAGLAGGMARRRAGGGEGVVQRAGERLEGRRVDRCVQVAGNDQPPAEVGGDPRDEGGLRPALVGAHVREMGRERMDRPSSRFHGDAQDAPGLA